MTDDFVDGDNLGGSNDREKPFEKDTLSFRSSRNHRWWAWFCDGTSGFRGEGWWRRRAGCDQPECYELRLRLDVCWGSAGQGRGDGDEHWQRNAGSAPDDRRAQNQRSVASV